MRFLPTLKTYTVHVKPATAKTSPDIRFVSEGFSWFALIFTGIWSMVHRVWWLLAMYVGYNIVLGYAMEERGLDVGVAMILQLGFHFLAGCGANDWLRDSLKRRGFETAAIVSGSNLGQAEQRFFDKHAALLAS